MVQINQRFWGDLQIWDSEETREGGKQSAHRGKDTAGASPWTGKKKREKKKKVGTIRPVSALTSAIVTNRNGDTHKLALKQCVFRTSLRVHGYLITCGERSTAAWTA